MKSRSQTFFVRLVILLTLLTSISAFRLLAKNKDKQKKNLNIVFIGDSITEGGGPEKPEDSAPFHAINYLKKQSGTGIIRFSNQGHSGFTTVDFLPTQGNTFIDAEKAADSLQKVNAGTLIFSIMLGTNDSAEEGPLGSPVSPAEYRKNLTTIMDKLLNDFPGCHIILHHATWYSPTTYNSSRYLASGLKRLQSYFPEITAIIKTYRQTHPGQVFTGDTKAFDFFRTNHKSYCITEHGQRGIFYLHPNTKGAKALGNFWGKAIYQAITLN